MTNELQHARNRVDAAAVNLASAIADLSQLRRARQRRNGATWYQAQRANVIEVYGFERGDVMFPAVAAA